MLFVPQPWDLTGRYSGDGATTEVRPASAMGVSFTLGASNTKGSWATVFSSSGPYYPSSTRAIKFVILNINSTYASSSSRLALVDIGVDTSGGTSFTTIIPNLIAHNAGPFTTGAGYWYAFPIFIPVGASIGVRGQTNGASTITGRLWMAGFSSMAYPGSTPQGFTVDALGINESTTSGTSISPGTTDYGSWATAIASTTQSYWWWQMGVGFNDSTISSNVSYLFRLIAGNESYWRYLTVGKAAFTNTGEYSGCQLQDGPECIAVTPSGIQVAASGFCSGTSDAGGQFAVYAVRR